jgi:hypothetical protein
MVLLKNITIADWWWGWPTEKHSVENPGYFRGPKNPVT